MINKLQQFFHSILKSLDVFYVLKDQKQVSRIIVNELELEKTKLFLESYNLKITTSDFKINSESEKDKEFTNKGTRIDKNNKEQVDFFIYISKNNESAEKAKEYEEKNDHKGLGRILGYPECCSKFFAEHFPIESKRYNDYILPALKNSESYEFPYKNNYCVRNFDLALISHFPCNFHCKKSLEIAEKNLNEIQKDNQEVAKILDGMLKGAVIYTEEQGIFFLRRTKLMKNKLFYLTVMASTDNQLSKDIKTSDFIEIIDKNKIKIKNKLLDGNYGFAIFS